MIVNVHQRDLAAPIERLGPLLDLLGSPGDAVWPAPAWPPMELDRPVVVGAAGGHDDIRYRVTEYEPGRRVRFEFDPECGFRGFHEFSLEALGASRTRLRHELRATAHGRMRVILPAVRVLHDVILEDLLDNAQAVASGAPPPRAEWGSSVRVLRRLSGRVPVRPAPLPAAAELVRDTIAEYGGAEVVDLLDVWSVRSHRSMSQDPQVWSEAVFGRPPQWVRVLLGLREELVGLVGIERGTSEAFSTRAGSGAEVLLGTDASHLDFRCSVLVADGAVTLTTVARCHNLRGRLYLLPVRVLHAHVLRAMLAHARDDLAHAAVPTGTAAPG
jgi:hypothetical protein